MLPATTGHPHVLGHGRPDHTRGRASPRVVAAHTARGITSTTTGSAPRQDEAAGAPVNKASCHHRGAGRVDSFEARRLARLASIDVRDRQLRWELGLLARYPPTSALARRCHACHRIADHVEDYTRHHRHDCPVHGNVLTYADKRGAPRSLFASRVAEVATLRGQIDALARRRDAVASGGRLF